MILPGELDHIVEPAIALGTPALLDKAFHLGSAGLHLGRDDIDVGQDHDRIT